jgi:hypothetical protein
MNNVPEERFDAFNEVNCEPSPTKLETEKYLM